MKETERNKRRVGLSAVEVTAVVEAVVVGE